MNFEMQTGTDDNTFKKEYYIEHSIMDSLIKSKYKYSPIIMDNNTVYIYPLKIYDNILGVLEIQYDNMRSYFQEDIVKYTCIVMSIMLDNERMSINLQKELEERNAIQKKLQMVINTGIDAYALIHINNLDVKWLEISNQCTNVFGWDCEDLNKINILDAVHPDDKKKIENALLNKVKENRDFECRVLCKNGQYKYII